MGIGAVLLVAILALTLTGGEPGDDSADEPTEQASPAAAAVADCILNSAAWVDLLTADPSAQAEMTYSLGIRHPMYPMIQQAVSVWHRSAVEHGRQVGIGAVGDYLRDKCDMTYRDRYDRDRATDAPPVPPPPG